MKNRAEVLALLRRLTIATGMVRIGFAIFVARFERP